jgi:hypothetical protein
MNGNCTPRRIVTAFAFGLTLLQLASTAVAAGPGVHGRVLGHDEQGSLLGVVAGARIQFQTLSGSQVAEMTSDGNGYYKVDLPAGEYLYKIEAKGYRKEDRGRGMRLSQSQGYAIFNLSLTKGTDDPNRKPPEVPLRKTGKLAGRVLENTPNGLVGIPNAKISLRREGASDLSSARSRATREGKKDIGDYEVTLNVGKFHASVMASGFETFADPQPIDIRSDEQTTRDFILSRTPTLDASSQGIQGAVTFVDSESPPPVIRVQIASLGDSDRAAIDVASTSSGAFKQPLPPGRYRVTASAEGYPTATSPPVYVLENRFAVANLTLRAKRVPEPRTTLEAFVFTKSPKGQPIPLSGARVSLLKLGAAAESATQTTSDSTGHALFPVAEAGEYRVSAFLQGYRPGTGSGAVEIGDSHQIEIELVKESGPPPVQLALEVLVSDAATKLPLVGASVLARHESESIAEAAHGTTDGQGSLKLTVKKSGSYTVLAQMPAYEPSAVKTAVSLGGENKSLIAMKRIRPERRPEQDSEQPSPPHEEPVAKPRPITGFVAYRELTGQLRSIANTKLIWERIAPATPPVSDFATTDGNGRYQVDVHVGTYQVRVLPPPGFEGLLEQVQILPETNEKYFIVHRAETKPPAEVIKVPLEGSVVTTDRTGRFTGVAGAEVLFTDAKDAEKTGTDRTGHFAARMAAGGYRVQVRAPGYEPLETRVDVRSGMSMLRFVIKRIEQTLTTSHLSLSVVERGRMGGSVRAVADAKVHITLNGQPAASGVSDIGGQYTTALNPGTYSVRVDKPGYTTASARFTIANRDVAEQIVLTRREETDSESTRKANLTVRVTQRAARTQAIRPVASPIPGAHVIVMLGSKQVASGSTNAAGIFSAPLPAGSYSVKAEAQGFAPAGKTISITSNDTQLDFQLNPLQAAMEDTSPPERVRQLPPDEFGRNRQPLSEPSDVHYIVEYRLKGQKNWTVLTTKHSQREANSVLVLALERKQIPTSAETRVRIEKGTETPDLRTRLRKF